jgi:tetraspanin-11
VYDRQNGATVTTFNCCRRKCLFNNNFSSHIFSIANYDYRIRSADDGPKYVFSLPQYFIIIFLLFVTMLIGGILGFVFREKVTQTMKQEMTSSLKLYGERYTITNAWDLTQERLKCCGVDSWRDWQKYALLPESCCQETYGGQKKPCRDSPSALTLHSNGCLTVTSTYIRENAVIIGAAGITMAILMVW